MAFARLCDNFPEAASEAMPDEVHSQPQLVMAQRGQRLNIGREAINIAHKAIVKITEKAAECIHAVAVEHIKLCDQVPER